MGMARGVVPVVKTVYVCDDVLQDPANGKTHLLGLFNAVRPPHDYPFRLGRLCVFAEFLDGVGSVWVRVEVVRLVNDGELVFRTRDHCLRFPGRGTTVSACFRIHDCVFPEPGVYLVELYCGDQFIDDRVIQLL